MWLDVWLVVLIDMALPSEMSADGKAQGTQRTSVGHELNSARPPRVRYVSLSGRSPGLRGTRATATCLQESPSHIATDTVDLTLHSLTVAGAAPDLHTL
jgi:hypothetical protein